jgi:short-subunit dehydrogenase
MNINLHSKTALVTGASSGLGMDFSRQLASRGCNLVLVARREDRLQALKEEIRKVHPVSVEIVALDLLQPDAPEQLFKRLNAAGIKVDVLINNAGLGLFGEFKDLTWPDMNRMLQVDVIALTHLTRLFAADMVSHGSGYIMMVGSTGSFQPTPTYAAYSAAKSYVLSLGEALHYELRKTGVGCTVLCPGVTRTEFFEVSGQQMTAYQKRSAMESADVAHIGIAAMLKGRSCVVAGGMNAFMAWGTRLLPRQTLAAIADRLMR